MSKPSGRSAGSGNRESSHALTAFLYSSSCSAACSASSWCCLLATRYCSSCPPGSGSTLSRRLGLGCGCGLVTLHHRGRGQGLVQRGHHEGSGEGERLVLLEPRDAEAAVRPVHGQGEVV